MMIGWKINRAYKPIGLNSLHSVIFTEPSKSLEKIMLAALQISLIYPEKWVAQARKCMGRVRVTTRW